MKFRRVPPVYSPISARALWRGLRAALSRGEADRARAELDEWVRQTYGPTEWLWTDSGTGALMLALRIAKAAGRRRVALPAYGCYDLATACDGAGVEVALYDVDPATLGPDWASLEGVLAGGSDIVVVAYLYGIPVDLDRVGALASRYGAVFIEDAAQGVGGSWQGLPLGAHGDLAVLSFGRGKGLTAGGGGLLMARREWAGPLRSLPPLPQPGRGLGGLVKSLVQWMFAHPSLYWIPAGLPFLGLGETVYRSWREPAGMGQAGLGQLAVNRLAVSAEAEARRRAAGDFAALVAGGGVVGAGWTASRDGVVPGFLRYPVLADPGVQGLLSMRCLWLGLSPGYPGSLAELQGFRWRSAGSAQFPGAGRLVAELLTLPTHGLLRAGDTAAIARALRGAGSKVGENSGREVA